VDRIQIAAMVAVIAVGSHLIVLLIRQISHRAMTAKLSYSFSKARTLNTLVTSTFIFAIYFLAGGFMLSIMEVPIGTYIAISSVIGIAVGFGSQSVIQDLIAGLTVIASDLFDVGDMVEISGQVGVVKSVGMRFTIIVNSFGAEVFIPNRTIVNVINYPRNYVRVLADVTLSNDSEKAARMEQTVRSAVTGTYEQFPGILMTEPTIEGRQKTSAGKEFLRVKFRIWPGRGGPIESTFKQEIVQALKQIDETYADWMVTINYEVEQRAVMPLPRSGRASMSGPKK
jgi:small-conductance mechanosensitive channel